MPLNGKFIEKYGKSFMEMDASERLMAVMSELFDLREGIEPLKKNCKTVERHSIYFTALWVILTMILIPVLLMVIKFWFN